MRKGVIYGRNSFDGRNWVVLWKSREKPGVARDLTGWMREMAREGFSFTTT
ncbi:hypothetical protein SAMN05443507_13022 [Alicyclobacillus tolerans]|uniref:Uncharacterized protein n=1 Tax=Alicyclobacillus tolerans TaxID=90970 RepID=A0A1M6WXP9_9BACL|nr:hypothetical protein SAMN05443507_13022 [Alicyclobacillus montanus]